MDYPEDYYNLILREITTCLLSDKVDEAANFLEKLESTNYLDPLFVKPVLDKLILALLIFGDQLDDFERGEKGLNLIGHNHDELLRNYDQKHFELIHLMALCFVMR